MTLKSLLRSGASRAPIACAAGLIVAVLSGSAAAQSEQVTALQRQIDDAFRQVLSAPGDMEVGLRYARLLVQAGNFEGGIAAMERLLLSPNPPPTIRLELGVLYYRLESYAAAETYLRAAAAQTDLPAEQRRLAEQLLSDAAKRNQPSRLSGFVMAGVRGQTNPLARTDEDFIRAGGALVARPSTQKRKSDTDTQLVGRIEHIYDLETQNSAELVSTLVGVAQHYSSVSSYKLKVGSDKPRDLLLAEGTTGIRFKPDPVDLPSWTLRPHVIAGNILLDGHQYAYNLGAGIESNYRVTDRFVIDAGYEARNYSYATRVDVAEAKQQGGLEHTVRLRASYELAPGQIVVGEVIGRDHGADRGYFAYQSGELRGTYILSYASPLGWWDAPAWTTSVSAGVLQRNYDTSDPVVDRSRTREDTEWRGTFATQIPIDPAWSILLQAEYIKANSNLPNYRYDNTSALASILWRF
ncbi:surface lipoprotein assembly modifier [Elstera litoralis]|uniref:surface lipoprotein assembly modifier n=1 Tax=Elstera litoralis TaxID=552518 RepID=UPI0018DC9C30|nr:surface lipoprotein assembly modifier [Elstera litoralis]